MVAFAFCKTKHPSSDLPGSRSTDSWPSGQQFIRQMEKAEPPMPLNLHMCQSVAYLSATGSTADYRETEFLAPLPHVFYLGHHFEPTANSTKNIIIKMPVAREEREKEKKVWTLATAPGVLCGGSLGSCDTFWAPEKAW